MNGKYGDPMKMTLRKNQYLKPRTSDPERKSGHRGYGLLRPLVAAYPNRETVR